MTEQGQDQATPESGLTDEQVQEAGEVLDKLAQAGAEEQDAGDATGEPFIQFGSEKEFQNAIDARLKERLEREGRKREAAEKKAAEKARQEAMEKNQEFESLAQERQARIEELENELQTLGSVKETAERYENALKTRVEAQMASVPEYVRDLLSDRDPVAQMEYLTKHAGNFDPAGPGAQPERDDAPESIWDMPKDRFEELQERAAAGEKVSLPNQR